LNALRKSILLIHEIGLPSLAAYASYTLQRQLGFYRSDRLTKSKLFSTKIDRTKILPVPILNFDLQTGTQSSVLGSADEILEGSFHPFGGVISRFDLSLPQPLKEWTNYSDSIDGRDIKEIWEPTRFTWALVLAEEFVRTGRDQYIECFWQYFEEFQANNPCYFGPNWISAQEVALRAINWLLIFPVLETSSTSTPERLDKLVQALWQHLLRLPLTIDYAKSQNNNHLLSESLGLFLLGSFFSPQSNFAQKWKIRSSSLFEKTLLAQIAPDGTYCQHSTNYHRMLLHLALIYQAACKQNGITLSSEITIRLAQATRWLQAHFDPISGQVSNLGHNDGTLLLPFGCREFSDYRPTLQFASLAFIGISALSPGYWDEISHRLGMDVQKSTVDTLVSPSFTSMRIGDDSLWASLRAVHFNERPGHADQLQVDIWWDGVNIARDAGTYTYNNPPPWQNALMATRVHNTVSIDNLDQMYRAGKFLWLKKAQATLKPAANGDAISASHDGYKELGITHLRTVRQPVELEIVVKDELQFMSQSVPRLVTLHWLFPDWQWQWDDGIFTVQKENRVVKLSITCETLDNIPLPIEEVRVVRAGTSLIGTREDKVMGWVSPTYDVKVPALSLSLDWHSSRSIVIHSNWRFRKDN
jgi:hypothetical protein